MFKKNILNVILCGCASASVTLQDDVGGGAEKVSTLDRLKFLFGNVHNEVKDIENEVSAAGSDFVSNGSRKLLRAQRTRGVAHVEVDVEVSARHCSSILAEISLHFSFINVKRFLAASFSKCRMRMKAMMVSR